MIVVIDFEMGNVGSILNMLKKIGVEAMLSINPEDLLKADRIILPGVGSFDEGMKNLIRLGLIPNLEQAVHDRKIPILGICLGMQLFLAGSEEGKIPGLGWIQGKNVRFKLDNISTKIKIPHMGWNNLNFKSPSNTFNTLGIAERYYFVHSYHALCDNPENVLATTFYGYDFPSAIIKNNIIGTQFHPEKSHHHGMAFLTRFAYWDGFSK